MTLTDSLFLTSSLSAFPNGKRGQVWGMHFFFFYILLYLRESLCLSLSLSHTLSLSHVYFLSVSYIICTILSLPASCLISFSMNHKEEKWKEGMKHFLLLFPQRRCCATRASLTPFFFSFDQLSHLRRKICISHPTASLIAKSPVCEVVEEGDSVT